MLKKKFKTEFDNEEVNNQLKKLIIDQDIINTQKCYLYTQLKIYKELYEKLEVKYKELELENNELYKKIKFNVHDERSTNFRIENINQNEKSNNINHNESKDKITNKNINNENLENSEIDDSINIKNIINEYKQTDEEFYPLKIRSILLEKDKKIIELENSIIKLQILSRSKNNKNEIEYNTDENEIINLKTKVEYSQIEKERLIINSNNKIMETRIKYEEFMKKYNEINEKYHNALLDMENLRNKIKEKEIIKNEQIEKIKNQTENIKNENEKFMQNINFIVKYFFSMQSLFVETNKLNTNLLDKLKKYKIFENKKNYKTGEEFYDEEINNLLEVCDSLTNENKILEEKINNLNKQVINFELEKSKYIQELEICNNKLKSNSSLKYIEDLSKQKKIILNLSQEIKISTEEKNKLIRLNVERIKLIDKYKDELKIKNIENVCLNTKNEDIYKMLHDIKEDIFIRLNNPNKEVKSFIICNLCDNNPKNVAIISCMHTFCEECINLRIKLRDRKCPTCGISFNVSDVKKLYL
ncbi:E3 ubiquitin-protein ligase BRE1 [Vairimorpha necatrix]|uniref:E3 ubiquitin protein ligase n=1 Tax=Vairimorpha necatrix TaxID=6039 RepID=A0AAX4JAB9_9MICR